MAILHVAASLDVGPMLASLGIGGIAVALATEDSIANILGSFTILFDKSFYRGAVISAGKRVLLAVDTTRELVDKALETIKKTLENHASMPSDRPPCVYLVGCKDRGFNTAVTAWYHPFDYWAFQEWVHATCPGNLIRRLKEAVITYAVAV